MTDEPRRIARPTRLTRRTFLEAGGVTVLGVGLSCADEPVGALVGGDGAVDAGAADAGQIAEDSGARDAAAADARAEVDSGSAADPDAAADAAVDAGTTADPPLPLFFVHLSDTHIGAQALSVATLTYALGEVVSAIAPLATFNTGDLVDDGGQAGQWTEYRDLIDASGMTADDLIEVPGNHDAKNDPDLFSFASHSHAGRAGRGPYGLRHLEIGDRRIRVVRVNTASGGGQARNLTGYLAEAQVDELIADIDADARPVEATIVIGHHPARAPVGLGLLRTDRFLYRLLNHTQALAYLCGHVHVPFARWEQRALMSQADTLGNPALSSNGAGFSVFAIDDGPSAVNVPLRGDASNVHVEWPVVMITRPAKIDLANNNPWAQRLPRASSGHLLRAGVFAPAAPDRVQYRVDGQAWAPMTNAGGSGCYEARFDTPDASTCEVEVEVMAVGHTSSDSVRIDLV